MTKKIEKAVNKVMKTLKPFDEFDREVIIEIAVEMLEQKKEVYCE